MSSQYGVANYLSLYPTIPEMRAYFAGRNADWRLDLLIEAAQASGVSLDELYGASVNLDDISFRQLMGRLSTSPR